MKPLTIQPIKQCIQGLLLLALAVASTVPAVAQVENLATRPTGVSCGICAGLPEIHAGIPILIEAILNDHTTPMGMKILNFKPVTQ